nr:uncharacterized protein LOC113803843 [Penaeus vannamei]
MIRCNLILVSLRDLFAQNVLQAFVDLLCDTQWLNTVLAEILSEVSDGATGVGGAGGLGGQSTGQEASSEVSDVSKILQQASNSEKLQAHTSLLEAIEEETLSELQQLDPAVALQSDAQQSQEGSSTKSEDDSEAKSAESEKFENAEALVQYVRSSSLEKESKEDEDYRTVSSALGTLLSTTAGPLLPDNSAMQYQPLVTKMWESPVDDKCFVDMSSLRRKKNPFSRNVVEGMKEEEYKLLYYPPKGKKKSSSGMKSTSKDKERNTVPKVEDLSNGKIEIRLNDSDLQDEEDIQRLSATPSIGEIPRSKSCGSLMNKENEETRHREGKTIHASLNELDKPNDQSEKSEKSGWQTDPSLSLSDDDMTNRKEKGHLVKMNSFDKNDGTDEISLEINRKLDVDSEPALKNRTVKEPSGFIAEENGCIPLNLPPGDVPQASSTPIDMTDGEPPGTLEISPPINNAGFGWENPDLSPIYEESEDLASSIAKLRSLLTERESQHSLGSLSSYGSSESEPKSAQSDPGRYTQEKSRFTFTHKDSSGSLASVKSVSSLESCGNGLADEELLEAAEIPLDGRVFLSVSVPSTEVHTEPGGSQYTLYTIQYDAIYLCESAATPQTEGAEEVAKEPLAVPEPRMVLQTNCVKRRFREFLTLHAALEEDSRLRTAMKGVKGPNKWLNLPFSKLDSTTIATRKQFLEKYLQSVIQRPEVNISTPVKEFLAYGSDSSVSFVKKPLELHVPRLDKLLAKTVSGVFHSLKTALPSFESSDTSTAGESAGNLGVNGGAGGDGMLKSKSGGVLSERNKLAAFLSSGNKAEYELKLDITAEEEECQIEEALMVEISGSDKDELVDTAYEARESRNLFSPVLYKRIQLQQQQEEQQSVQQQPPEQQLHQHQLSVVVGRGSAAYAAPPSPAFHAVPPPSAISKEEACDPLALTRRESQEDSPNEGEEDCAWQKWPLSVGVMDAVVEILSPSDHPITHQPCVTLLTLTAARITHRWLQAELERLSSEPQMTEYIHALREAILSAEERTPEPELSDIEASRIQLQEALSNFVPGFLKMMLGKELTQQAIMRMIDSIQYPTVTADLALHILDLLVIRLIPVAPLML